MTARKPTYRPSATRVSKIVFFPVWVAAVIEGIECLLSLLLSLPFRLMPI